MNPKITFGNQMIALINCDKAVNTLLDICNLEDRQLINFKNAAELVAAYEEQNLNIVAVISQSEVSGPFGNELLENLSKMGFPKLPFILICKELDPNVKKLALRAGVAEAFTLPLKVEKIEKRVNFLINYWEGLTKFRKNLTQNPYRVPNETRAFDIIFSGFCLILFSPLFLLFAILIKLESKGPVFSHSFRVGSNYRIFKMLSFRTMKLSGEHVNGNSHSSNITHAANSTQEIGNCDDCRANSVVCQFPVFAGKVTCCEKKFMYKEKLIEGTSKSGYVPEIRLTMVGRFLRLTRLSHLPQLVNVFRGEMSVVGNMPLPLSEAEKLTTDRYVLRFMAPAGMTGLWQIERRKKKYGEQPGRLVLDNRYARNQNFHSDIILLFKTFPALFR
ncbi:MAG: sugar transferase [Daejeonella sp.]